MNQLGQFEQNLLTELREVVAERATAPQPRRALPRKRLALAAAGGGLLAAGLLVGLPALNGEQTQAAYAVATNDDGTVTIEINRLEDPEGLEHDLAAHGITAQIDFAPPGKACQLTASRFDPDQAPRIHAFAGDEGTITVRMADVAGKTLVIQGGRVTGGEPGVPKEVYAFMYRIADGPVEHCVLVDQP